MISRRDSLKWMFATSASGFIAENAYAASADTLSITALGLGASWPVVGLPQIKALGYGTDPDTTSPTVPWPLTLAKAHRDLINTLGNWLLPADELSKGAGDCDIAAFFDEWVSAPYPAQQKDRLPLLALLLWIDAQSRILTGTNFINAQQDTQQHLVEAMLYGADVPHQAVETFSRFRILVIFGYYTMPDNLPAAGLEPEAPIIGEYPGPTPEAITHLNALLKSLDLEAFA